MDFCSICVKLLESNIHFDILMVLFEKADEIERFQILSSITYMAKHASPNTTKQIKVNPYSYFYKVSPCIWTESI